MASTTVKPYPHVQINVKDNSIASVSFTEVLPVHRPLYVMRTQKGPLGRPVWCRTYPEAAALFGAETFNPANKTYFSLPALYLRETFTRNGAFISRYLPEGHSTASAVLYAFVTAVAADPGIPQYEYNGGYRAQEYDEDAVDSLYWVDKETGTKAAGIKIKFAIQALQAGDDPTSSSFSAIKKVGDAIRIPIAYFSAEYAGAYGNDLAFKLFYNNKANDPGDVTYYKTLFYNIGFAERDPNTTTWNSITDIYNRDSAAFSANPDAVNPDTGAPLDIDYVLDKGFSDETHQLPVKFDFFESNLNILGLMIAASEDDVQASDGTITYKSLNGYGADPDAIIGALTADEKTEVKGWISSGTVAFDDAKWTSEHKTFGYMVNAIGLKNLLDVPYDHVIFDDGATPTGYTGVNLLAFDNNALVEGSDGTFVANDDTTAQASDDLGMYNFAKLRAEGVKDEIVESLHYPFTHIFDVGYSFKTKKAMLDFLDIRDDVMMIMSTQVLMSDGSGRSISDNDQATDEGNLEALRAYALLMRESVLFGTDCMRASLYCHCGKLVNSVYTGTVPFTYWSAIQYAQYGNMSFMNQQEPRGLPESYNLLFKSWNWWNYRADSQSRVWDNGGNYVQYADMTRIFYPALRTVYRASTSVLVDEWFVAAVVYAKYVCRRAWARFSGRNDSAAVLQGAIKQYLDAELAALFNSKYAFEVSVYQTAEEQELGYIQHVKLKITSGPTMRVLDVDIEVNRENFVAEE